MRLKDFDRTRFRELTHMGSWLTISYVGVLLFTNISLIIVNKIYGATAGGEYAIALQWTTIITSISVVFIGLLSPIILTYYARGKTDSLLKVSQSAVKLSVLFLALPVGLLCGLAPEILTVWIGKDFAFLATLMTILIVHLTINMGVQPLSTISWAYNRVRTPGIVTIVLGLGNLFFATTFSLYTNWGFYGVAITCMIFMTLRFAVFTPWYSSRILGAPLGTFYRPMLPGMIALTIIAASAFALSEVVNVANLLSLIVIGGVFSAVYTAGIWFLALDGFERELFISFMPSHIQRCFL
jgi:O-antigen/teichoic acid export membrane protein